MNEETLTKIRECIRDVPDFPKPGIVYKDITPLLANASVFTMCMDAFAQRYADKRIDVVVGIESRGFIFGTPLAERLKASFVPARKPGKLPWNTISAEYTLEYGKDEIEMHTDAIKKGDRVLIVDDLIATGGTASAAVTLAQSLGGTVVEAAFLIELSFLKGTEALDAPSFSILRY